MHKIATPQDLQNELRTLLAYASEANPSRQILASWMATLAERVAADSPMTQAEFAEAVKKIDVKDRTINVPKGSLGHSSDLYINFYNVPSSQARGATGENNRQSFTVEGWDKKTPDAPAPTGKVKIEGRVSALGREYNIRAKTGTPEAILSYLEKHLKKIVSEVEPKIT